MLLKFLTALAWLWGAFCVIGFFIQFCPPIRDEDLSRALRIAVYGIPAFAWLIAVYGNL